MAEPKYIDAEDAIRAVFLTYMGDETEDVATVSARAIKRLEALPAADVVEVVRCKDCKHWREYIESFPTCGVNREVDGSEKQTKQMDFCSYGERKDG